MYFYHRTEENKDFVVVNENEDDSATKLDITVLWAWETEIKSIEATLGLAQCFLFFLTPMEHDIDIQDLLVCDSLIVGPFQ